MKKLLVILALGTLSCASFAQGNTTNTKGTGEFKPGILKNDCIMMKDSMLMIIKNGEVMMMNNPVQLNNGVTVLVNGDVKMADGTTIPLKEGQVIDMDSKIAMIGGRVKSKK